MTEAIKTLPASNLETVRPAQVLASLQKLRSEALQHRLKVGNDEDENPDAMAEREQETTVNRAWKAYEKILEVRGVLDFDLLLIRTIRLLEDHPNVSDHNQFQCNSDA